MTLATLTWERHTTTFSLAGATPTLAEFLKKISDFITASSTYWKVTGSDLTGAGVANAGYVELAPKSAVAGITEMRALIAYTDATTPVAINSLNRMAPFAAVTTATRIWFGVSPNAATTGPDANPYSGKAYSTAAWGGMFPAYAGSAVIVPNNGGELAIIESNEALVITYFNSANQITTMMFGRMVEAPDGNSAEVVMGGSIAQWSSAPTGPSSGNAFGFPRIYQNSSTGSVSSYPKMVTIANDGTLESASFCLESAGNNDFQQYLSGTNAYLQAWLCAGGAWGGGDLSTGRGIWRQLRHGPMAWNGQTMTDGATLQAIALNFHASVQQVGTIWFDQQR